MIFGRPIYSYCTYHWVNPPIEHLAWPCATFRFISLLNSFLPHLAFNLPRCTLIALLARCHVASGSFPFTCLITISDTAMFSLSYGCCGIQMLEQHRYKCSQILSLEYLVLCFFFFIMVHKLLIEGIYSGFDAYFNIFFWRICPQIFSNFSSNLTVY